MLYVLLHIWPWALGALALGAVTGIFAGRLAVQSAPAPKRAEPKKIVKEPVAAALPAPSGAAPEQIQALEKQLAARDASLADLRAGLDREIALRRAAIARIEGLMVDQQAQAPTRPAKGGKASAKSSPSQ